MVTSFVYFHPGKADFLHDRMRAFFRGFFRSGSGRWISELDLDRSHLTAEARGPAFAAQVRCSDGRILIELRINPWFKLLAPQIESDLARLLERTLPEGELRRERRSKAS